MAFKLPLALASGEIANKEGFSRIGKKAFPLGFSPIELKLNDDCSFDYGSAKALLVVCFLQLKLEAIDKRISRTQLNEKGRLLDRLKYEERYRDYSPPNIIRREILPPRIAVLDHQKGNSAVERDTRIESSAEAITVPARRSDRDRDLVLRYPADDRDTPVFLRSNKQASTERDARESYLSFGRFHDFRNDLYSDSGICTR